MSNNQEKNKTDNKVEKVERKTAIKKKFNGVVIGDKPDKTIVVRVDSVKVHPKYKKRYTSSKKYKVHDEDNSFKIDDRVSFVECRPLSKGKKWRVINNKTE